MNVGTVRRRAVGLLASPLLLALVACGAEPPAPAAPPPQLDFGAKRSIPVRVDLRTTADGGRVTPIAGAWRGEFAFDGGDSTRCGIDSDAAAELAPGSSHEARLFCAGPVRLPEDGGRAFRVFEEGREVGSGVILP